MYKQVLQNLDIAITSIYATEALLKIIAYKFVFATHSYLRDPWNIIDFVSLLISISSWFSSNGLGFFKALRAFRILKISRHFQGLKLILTSLAFSMPMIIILCLFALTVLLIFGLFPVKYLKGSLYKCVSLDTGVS